MSRPVRSPEIEELFDPTVSVRIAEILAEHAVHTEEDLDAGLFTAARMAKMLFPDQPTEGATWEILCHRTWGLMQVRASAPVQTELARWNLILCRHSRSEVPAAYATDVEELVIRDFAEPMLKGLGRSSRNLADHAQFLIERKPGLRPQIRERLEKATVEIREALGDLADLEATEPEGRP